MEKFYLSEHEHLSRVLELTGLSLDELEYIVGKFPSDHHRWPNQFRGEFVQSKRGMVIRHHFTKKKLWETDEPLDFQEDLDLYE